MKVFRFLKANLVVRGAVRYINKGELPTRLFDDILIFDIQEYTRKGADIKEI